MSAPDLTPTPPPMVVSHAPAIEEEEPVALAEPEAPSKRRVWALVPLLAITCLMSAVGFRHLRNAGQLPWSQIALAAHTTTTVVGSATGKAPHAAPAAAGEDEQAQSEWTVTYEGHIPIAGGVMFLPKSFEPDADGSYDLVLHFHGNVNIVKESIEHAHVNAVLAVVNWGISSKPYRNEYRAPDTFEKLLAQIDGGVKKRGVKTPKLRRLALTSWSAGYGAIESILEHRRSPAADADYLDAIIAIDGVHAAYLDGDPKQLRERTLLAWVNAAKAAAKGGVMLSMTHSQILPPGFASARRSQEFVLKQLEEEPQSPAMLRRPQHLALESAKIAVAQGKEKFMIPTMDVRLGNLRVQGFEGITKEHHIAHLTQMASVVLPDLTKRWGKPEGPRLSRAE